MFFVVAAAGQLISIFCRHGILNALIGIGVCVLVATWVRYLNWYQVPTWSYAWPIAIAALGLSWWYAPSWIRGTRQLSSSLISIAVMTVVGVACIAGLRHDRLNDFTERPFFAELSDVLERPEKFKDAGDPRFEVARKIESAQAKIELGWSEIRERGQESKPVPNQTRIFSEAELKLVEDHRAEFEAIVNLVRDPDMRFFYFQSPDAAEKLRASKAVRLRRLIDLFGAATKSKGEDQLDALMADLALSLNSNTSIEGHQSRNFLKWADDENRAVGELKAAIEQLDLLTQSIFSSNNLQSLETEYQRMLTKLNEYKDADFNSMRRFDLPWEVEREKRKFENDLLYRWQKSRVPRLSRKPKPSYFVHDLQQSVSNSRAAMRESFGFRSSSLQSDFDHGSSSRVWLRYLKIRFALAAWKLDNGDYPKKLSDLDEVYLQFDTDYPIYNQMTYYPQGLDLAVVLRPPNHENHFYRTNTVSEVIPSSTPFLLPWQTAPTEKELFVVATKNKDGTETTSETDPELGYLMGQWQNHEHLESYIIGNN
jgi:hypothetical protein